MGGLESLPGNVKQGAGETALDIWDKVGMLGQTHLLTLPPTRSICFSPTEKLKNLQGNLR